MCIRDSCLGLCACKQTLVSTVGTMAIRTPAAGASMTQIRTGQAPPPLTRAEFQTRFSGRFYDPAFEGEREAIARLEAIAWDALQQGRKAPITIWLPPPVPTRSPSSRNFSVDSRAARASS